MKLFIPLFFALILASCSSSPKQPQIESGSKDNSAAPAAKPATVATTKAAKVAAEKPAAATGTVTCTHKEEKRIIEVRSKDKGCETAYTKAGAESVVATSNSGTAHCMKVQSRIQENLKGAGYTCQ